MLKFDFLKLNFITYVCHQQKKCVYSEKMSSDKENL